MSYNPKLFYLKLVEQIADWGSSAENDYFKTSGLVKRSLRAYSLESIINVGLIIVRSNMTKGREEVLGAPWIIFLIIKLAIEDTQVHYTAGKAISEEAFIKLKDLLWNTKTDFDKSSSIEITLRSIVHSQLQFQALPNISFIYLPALIARLDKTHPLQVQFETVMGFEPDMFVAIVWSIFAAIEENKHEFQLSWFKDFKSVFGNHLNTFLFNFSKSLPELRAILRSELKDRIDSRGHKFARQNYELKEFPWLSKYPLLRTENSTYQIWHPLIFARGMETATHNALATLNQSFSDEFSKVFESYVLELISNVGFKYLNEDEIRQAKRDNPAVEALISLDEANIMIESKMALFKEEIYLTNMPKRLYAATLRVREAMVQGWKVGSLMRANDSKYKTSHDKPEDFLLIITNKQLNLCSGEHMVRYLGNLLTDQITRNFGRPTTIQIEKLPYKNISILDIIEFENLMMACNGDASKLLHFLRFAAERNSNPATASFVINDLIQKHFKKIGKKKLIEETSDRVLKNLEIKLRAQTTSTGYLGPE